LIQEPLKNLQLSVSELKDQIEILKSEILDLHEQQRLGLFKRGTKVKHLETEDERQKQTAQLSQLNDRNNKLQSELKQLKEQYQVESEGLKTKIRKELYSKRSACELFPR